MRLIVCVQAAWGWRSVSVWRDRLQTELLLVVGPVGELQVKQVYRYLGSFHQVRNVQKAEGRKFLYCLFFFAPRH